MKTRKYFFSYRCLQPDGRWGFGNTSLDITNGKLQYGDLGWCRQKIKEECAERGIEIDADKIVFIFIKDVTNGF